MTFVDAYPKFSVLRGAVIPPAGGDTIWSNTHAAYESLPEPLKLLADTLWAVHSNVYDYAAVRPRGLPTAQAFRGSVHLDGLRDRASCRAGASGNGRAQLLLGNFVQRIVGLSKSDSAKLYEVFQSYVTAPENTVRWRWRAGDVAIWDIGPRNTTPSTTMATSTAWCVARRSMATSVSVDGRRSVTRIKTEKPRAKAA